MEIINAGLEFRSLTNRSRTDMCILHHTACSVASPEDIHRWHLNNGWSGAGYNLYVRKDGTVYELRPMNCVGAHAQGYNSISIGVCFEGNFEEEDMTDAQVESGKQVVAYVKSVYGDIPFKGHRDVNSTSCPGANFKFDEIVCGAPSPSPEPQPSPEPTPSGAIAEVQQWCCDYGYKITVDNKFGNQTKKALTKILQNEMNKQFGAGLAIDGIWGSKSKAAWRNIKQGMSGNITKAIQGFLICYGFDTNGFDGQFGSGTAEAVRSYQVNRGLKVDAIVGKITISKMTE